MAPRRPPTGAKPDKNASSEKSSKLVKRPARGYHKFRSGVLNVAPKGAEKASVRANQNSPLLRLPPEIRDRIWTYALGGKTFMTGYAFNPLRSKFIPSASEPSNGVALLRSCRQIYSETALYPSRLGIFTCTRPYTLKRSAKMLKAYHRKQVMRLRFACKGVNGFSSLTSDTFSSHNIILKKIFPALSHIEVLIHEVSDKEDDGFKKAADYIRTGLSKVVEESGCTMMVEGTVEEMESDIEY